MTVTFIDDFETGDFSKWIYGVFGSPSISTIRKYLGNYGATATGPTQSGAWTSVDGKTHFSVRGYFRFGHSTVGDWVETQFISLLDSAWVAHIAMASISKQPNNQYVWNVYSNTTEATSTTPFTADPNHWYYIELEVLPNQVNLYVDSTTPILTITGVTTNVANIAVMAVGLYYSGGTVVLDWDTIAAGDAYIGPITTATGTLSVTATAGGSLVMATVTVGGQSGNTPVTFTLSPGTYTVSAVYGSQTLTSSATVIAGQNTPLNFAFAAPTGNLEVHAYQDGTEIAASVTADGKSGTTPVTFPFPPGTYTLTATYQDQTPPAQTVSLAAAQTVIVNFHFLAAPTSITLEVTAGANGTVSPIGLVTLVIGHSYAFQASPAPGYTVDHWDLSGSSLGSTGTLNLTATADMNGKVLTALFTSLPPPQVSMNVAAAGAGTVNPAPGAHTFNVGDTPQFTAIPEAGQTFKQWTLDGTVYTDNPLPLTIDATMQGKTLTAEFTGPPAAAGLDLPTVGSILLGIADVGLMAWGAARLAGLV
jgi:hypothetical protein